MALFALFLGACSAPENRVLEADLDTLIDEIYSYEGLSEDAKDFTENLEKKEVSEDKTAYHLGSEDIEYEKALASVPSLSNTPYELTLVRTTRNQDVEATITEIEENIDPMKWVSYGVDEENVIVDNIGDVIVIIMSDNYAGELHEAFLALEPSPES